MAVSYWLKKMWCFSFTHINTWLSFCGICCKTIHLFCPN